MTESLSSTLATILTVEEMRVFVKHSIDPTLLLDLPDGTISRNALAFALVDLLDRRGLLSPDLLSNLERSFPGRRDELSALRATLSALDPQFRPEPIWREEERMLRIDLRSLELQRRELSVHDERAVAELQLKIFMLKQRLNDGPVLQAGNFLGQRYELLSAVGQGGLAAVWKAWDEREQRLVAVKVLHSKYRHDKTAVECLFRGARTMSQVIHPNVARVLELDTFISSTRPPDHYYYVMEYIDGQNLAQAIEGGLPFRRALDHIISIGEALCAVHSKGYIHKDVKAANILLAGELPLLTDFDLVVDPSTVVATRVWGSTLHWAPEVEVGDAAGPWTDVFSLGVTLFYAYRCGKLASRDVYAAAEGRGVADPRLLPLLRTALADAPGRYRTMREFVDALLQLRTELDAAEDKEIARAVALRQKDQAEAEAAITRVLQANPRAIHALAERGLASLDNGDDVSAYADFDAVERLCGTDTAPLVEIGTSLLRRGAWNAAQRYLGWVQAVQGIVGQRGAWLAAAAYQERCSAARLATRDAKAWPSVDSFRDSLAEFPWQSELRLALSGLLIHEGHADEAELALIEGMEALGPSPVLMRALGQLWRDRGYLPLAEWWEASATSAELELPVSTRAARAEKDLASERSARLAAETQLKELRKQVAELSRALESELKIRAEAQQMLAEERAKRVSSGRGGYGSGGNRW